MKYTRRSEHSFSGCVSGKHLENFHCNSKANLSKIQE